MPRRQLWSVARATMRDSSSATPLEAQVNRSPICGLVGTAIGIVYLHRAAVPLIGEILAGGEESKTDPVDYVLCPKRQGGPTLIGCGVRTVDEIGAWYPLDPWRKRETGRMLIAQLGLEVMVGSTRDVVALEG